MGKTVFVRDLAPGDNVDDVFAAADKQVLLKKNGERYLTVALSDVSGRVKAVAWDNVEEIKAAFESGDYVWVKGRAADYRGEIQVVMAEAARLDPGGVDPSLFLPKTRRDPEKMLARLAALAESIGRGPLRELCAGLLSDTAFTGRFIHAPAAKSMHHAYVGGLLEHTLSVALMAEKVALHYGLDRDFLIAGALFHDLGKIEEFSMKGAIEYSDEGRLLNHVVLGLRLLDGRIALQADLPPEEALLLRHMVVSHHGAREFGAPEPPKTLEAVALNLIDDLDAKVAGIRDFLDSQTGDGAWSAYHNLLGRHFFRGGGR